MKKLTNYEPEYSEISRNRIITLETILSLYGGSNSIPLYQSWDKVTVAQFFYSRAGAKSCLQLTIVVPVRRQFQVLVHTFCLVFRQNFSCLMLCFILQACCLVKFKRILSLVFFCFFFLVWELRLQTHASMFSEYIQTQDHMAGYCIHWAIFSAQGNGSYPPQLTYMCFLPCTTHPFSHWTLLSVNETFFKKSKHRKILQTDWLELHDCLELEYCRWNVKPLVPSVTIYHPLLLLTKYSFNYSGKPLQCINPEESQSWDSYHIGSGTYSKDFLALVWYQYIWQIP